MKEYQNLVIFYYRPFFREKFKEFMFAQSEFGPKMIELIQQHRGTQRWLMD